MVSIILGTSGWSVWNESSIPMTFFFFLSPYFFSSSFFFASALLGAFKNSNLFFDSINLYFKIVIVSSTCLILVNFFALSVSWVYMVSSTISFSPMFTSTRILVFFASYRSCNWLTFLLSISTSKFYCSYIWCSRSSILICTVLSKCIWSGSWASLSLFCRSIS